MAKYNLADQLEKKIGKRTRKGTKITEQLVDRVRGDVSGNLIIAEDNTEQIVNALNRAYAAALEEIGLAAERFAKEKAPVDTGRLRNSITHALDMHGSSGDVYIGTNVEYAPYIELGTSKRKARPFLHPAAENHGEFYRGILEKHMTSG